MYIKVNCVTFINLCGKLGQGTVCSEYLYEISVRASEFVTIENFHQNSVTILLREV